MSLKEEKATDLAQVIAEYGEPVMWNGKTFQALVSSLTISQDLEIGGIVESADFTVKIPIDSFSASLPKQGDRITFDSQEYRITKINRHPQYPALILNIFSADE